ncbi:hypothetical protein V6N12_028627 [Hibiscus sabdariffa]|uniref:Uncharacterized protein n=1 Tax=Hibiscus sabdariffa TaxID=183260 RepID=A0ABR2F6D5_9ROSI
MSPFSPALNPPFLSLAAISDNEQLCREAGIPMTSGQPRKYRRRLCVDQSTMVQLSALEMAIEVSGIKKFYKFVRTCYQTNLKSYPFAISDEWNVLASKHRRFSSEFDLAKGDGWLKEIEGW